MCGYLRFRLVKRLPIRLRLGIILHNDHVLPHKNRAVPARLAGRNLNFYLSLGHNLLPNEIICRSNQNTQDVPGQIAPAGNTTVMLVPNLLADADRKCDYGRSPPREHPTETNGQ